jgi:hypothetical protein
MVRICHTGRLDTLLHCMRNDEAETGQEEFKTGLLVAMAGSESPSIASPSVESSSSCPQPAGRRKTILYTLYNAVQTLYNTVLTSSQLVGVTLPNTHKPSPWPQNYWHACT